MEIERGLIRTSAGYIHYRAAGKGTPLFILHINPQSSAMYLELMEVLGKKLRAIAIDYPSYGCSDHVPGQPVINDYARWVTEVMDGLGVTKASFLGEATGASISVELANAFPNRVGKVIMVSCPWLTGEEINRMRHAQSKTEGHPVDSTGFPLTRTLGFVLEKNQKHIPMHPTQSWMDRANVALIEAGRDRFQAVNAVFQYDLAHNLERIQCPVLLIWGEHFFTLHFRDEFTQRIKNHRVLILKNARLNLPWEFPEEVGQAVLKFLAE